MPLYTIVEPELKTRVPVGVRRFPADVFNCNGPNGSVEPTLSVPFSVNEPVPVIAEVPTSNVAKELTVKFILLMVPEFVKVWTVLLVKLILAVADVLAFKVLDELIEKLPNRLKVPVPPNKLAMLKVAAADGFIVKLPLTVNVADPEVANVLVEPATLLLIEKLPATVTALPVPVVEKTRRPEPSIIILPDTLNDPLLEVSNSLRVLLAPPVAETVKFPPILPSPPAKLINAVVAEVPFGQFQVKW